MTKLADFLEKLSSDEEFETEYDKRPEATMGTSASTTTRSTW